MTGKASFQKDAFVSTAHYYLRYRPPYPEALVEDLVTRVRADRSHSLLDLACGPGSVAFALASHFSTILAIDLEPEMIAEGRREATSRCISHIEWRVGSAEDCELPRDAFALITIGNAFHRLDQAKVLEKAMNWLAPGGAVAILGSGTTLGDNAVQGIVGPIVQKWTGTEQAAATPDSGPEQCEQALRNRGFVEVASYPFDANHVWSVESVVGNFFSTSFASRSKLGEKSDAFAAAIQRALLARNPSGMFSETLHFGYSFGRKPRP